MIRLARAIFFQHSSPCTFYLMRKNLSVKPESEINKLDLQEYVDKEFRTSKKQKLPQPKGQDVEEMKSLSLSDFKFLRASTVNKVYDEKEAELFAKNLSLPQVIQAFKTIVFSKTRPSVLLKFLSSKLKSTHDEYSLKNCADIMYCAASLNFKDVELLDKLADCLLSCKDSITEEYITNILHSIGKLKYRNTELIDFLLSKLLASKNYSIKSMLGGLITLGVVNHMSSYGVTISNELLKLSDKEFPLSKAYIDFVWACILTNQFPVQHISNILSKEFVEHVKVLYGTSNYLTPVAYKLHNINAAATHLMPDYKGPKLNDELFADIIQKNSNVQFLSSVIDGLSHIFPKQGYLATNIDTKTGFILDVECYIDKNCNPKPLKKMEGVKIGIMLLQFNNMCLGKGRQICGMTSFKQKIFEALGYKVVQIFQDEYNANLKLYDKVGYLRQKLKNCVTT